MSLSDRLNAIAGELAQAHSIEYADLLVEIANELDELYVPADTDGGLPTNAQAVALARVIRGRWSNGVAFNVTIQREPYETPSGYIGFSFVDGYTGGIDREGRVST